LKKQTSKTHANKIVTQEQTREAMFDKVVKSIIIHAVTPTDETDVCDVHTHGMENYSHLNFAVFAPGLFLESARFLLLCMADSVINDHDKFEDGEKIDTEAWGTFTIIKSVDAGDETVLRIVASTPTCDVCDCEDCQKEE
jgi:hypothetical protein